MRCMSGGWGGGPANATFPRTREPVGAACVPLPLGPRFRGGDDNASYLVEHQRPQFDTLARRHVVRRGWILEGSVRQKASTAVGR